MKLLLLGLALLLTACTTPTKPQNNDSPTYKNCLQAHFEKYCKTTDKGLAHVLKEGLRTAIEIRTGTSIDDACEQVTATWGYDFRPDVDKRIDYYCGATEGDQPEN